METISTVEAPAPVCEAPLVEEKPKIIVGAKPKVFSIDEALHKKISRYARLSRRSKKIEAAQKEIKEEIFQFVGNQAAVLNYVQEQVAKVNAKEQSSPDWEKLEAAYPGIDKVKFTKKTPYLELRTS